jgi:hypothetical protein
MVAFSIASRHPSTADFLRESLELPNYANCSSRLEPCDTLRTTLFMRIFLWLILSIRNQTPPLFPIFCHLLETDVSNDRHAAIKIAEFSQHFAIRAGISGLAGCGIILQQDMWGCGDVFVRHVVNASSFETIHIANVLFSPAFRCQGAVLIAAEKFMQMTSL